jgi:acyl-CoA synthetase (AMP-forming)/AMP-acid ligase II
MSHSDGGTCAEVSCDRTMPEVWRHLASSYGDHDFLVATSADGGVERVTYRDVEERSAQLARVLIGLGVTKGSRVGLLLPNGVHYPTAFLAATRIGAVAVPINTFFKAPELSWLLNDSDIHTLIIVSAIVGKSVLDRLESAVPGLADAGPGPLSLPSMPNLRNVVCLDGTDRTWLSDGTTPASHELLATMEAAVRPADDLFILYTSGSTSTPKGAVHTHGPALVHSSFIASGHDWRHDDRIYVPMGLFWIGGLVYGLLGPMQLGATILTEDHFDASQVLRLLEQERATYTTGWPHVGAALSNHPDFPMTDLSSLRGGYQQTLMPPDLRPADPGLRAVFLGMTETCSAHTWWPPHDNLPASKRGSLGVSAPGFEHLIVDDKGNEVPEGERGEVWVRGYALMRGMVGRSRADVFDLDGWYHTGDVGHRDEDGHLYFAGRIDDLIKTAGANVSPMEVESILRLLPGVREAYVIGLPDEVRGATVAAAVITNVGITLAPDTLREWCRERLASYKVPKKWSILDSPDSLPYTTTNKIDRRRLIAQFDTLPSSNSEG